jgi:hypothetical protein
MARSPSADRSQLSKMELRKLNALCKSIGDELGAKAFNEWRRARPAPEKAEPIDKTAEAIAEAVMKLINGGAIKSLPRGGYTIKRGRGRVVVEAAS